jgi:hypothetical protein
MLRRPGIFIENKQANFGGYFIEIKNYHRIGPTSTFIEFVRVLREGSLEEKWPKSQDMIASFETLLSRQGMCGGEPV